jgi:excisionase family DNA binding protein
VFSLARVREARSTFFNMAALTLAYWLWCYPRSKGTTKMRILMLAFPERDEKGAGNVAEPRGRYRGGLLADFGAHAPKFALTPPGCHSPSHRFAFAVILLAMASRGDRTHGLTVTEAADQLGISVEAVRQRLKRGTLRHTKREGRVYVHLDDDQPTDRTTDHDALVESLREQLEQLRQQLERADERDRENRRLLAAALERIPPQLEPPKSPETVEEAPEGAEPRSAAGGAQEGSKQPWWRRWLGG